MAKKKNNSYKTVFIIFKIVIDLIVAWFAYDYYKAGNKTLTYIIAGIYILIRIIIFIRNLRRKKYRDEFTEMFPDD